MEYIFWENKKLDVNIYILPKNSGIMMNNYVKNSENKNEVTTMKRLIAVTGISLFICLLISASPGSSPIRADATEKAPGSSLSSEQPMNSTICKAPASYVLKAYKKRVAVFESGKDTPLWICPTNISQLPKQDRELLEVGISAPDRKSLNRLLEDFCS